jgi:hypothetical protein
MFDTNVTESINISFHKDLTLIHSRQFQILITDINSALGRGQCFRCFGGTYYLHLKSQACRVGGFLCVYLFMAIAMSASSALLPVNNPPGGRKPGGWCPLRHGQWTGNVVKGNKRTFQEPRNAPPPNYRQLESFVHSRALNRATNRLTFHADAGIELSI